MDPRRKIKGSKELKGICQELHHLGRIISLTTGAYDLLHDGHLKYLLEASKFGDVLIVGVDSDDFVRGKKGEGRPINNQGVRSFLVAGFECVDLVTIRADIMELIQIVRPDYLVRSETSGPNQELRKDCVWVRENCGQAIILGQMSPNHTTTILEAVRKNKG
jgi:rfaE bifunctional protein nucleotidyltransferase chain/domain